MAKTTKLRETVRKHLPFGKYRYIVCFNSTIFNTVSTKYNLLKSATTLTEYKNKSQRRRALNSILKDNLMAPARPRRFSSTSTRKPISTTVDSILNDLDGMVIGKMKINFNFRRRIPLKLYFTNYEDLTYLFFQYKKNIERIHKVIVKDIDVEFELKDPGVESIKTWFIENNSIEFFDSYKEAALRSKELNLPLYQTLTTK